MKDYKDVVRLRKEIKNSPNEIKAWEKRDELADITLEVGW